MANITEIVDLDSGVASSEATPEGQTVITSAAEEAAKMALAGEEVLEVKKEEPAAEKEPDNVITDLLPVTTVTTSSAAAVPAVTGTPSVGVEAVEDEEEQEEEDEDVDESFVERLLALTEMFPTSLRAASAGAVNSTASLLKSSYHLTRQVVWVGVSSSIILFAPVMFELERLNVEEMMKHDRNRLVLGPGSAMSGAPPTSPGLMPPPPPAR